MAQRLVAWNETGFLPQELGKVTALHLEYAALVRQRPELAAAIDGGRIISHNVCYYGHGVLLTFIVETGPSRASPGAGHDETGTRLPPGEAGHGHRSHRET